MRRFLFLPFLLMLAVFSPATTVTAQAADCARLICVSPGGGGGEGAIPPGYSTGLQSSASRVKVNARWTLTAAQASKPSTFTFQIKSGTAWKNIYTVAPSRKSVTISLKAPASAGKFTYRVVASTPRGNAVSNAVNVAFVK
jgi:hypothetical protein